MRNQVYIIDGLDCANCAAKIERKINDLPQVEQATITFATRQLRVTAEDPDSLLPEMLKLARSVEEGAEIYPRDSRKASHREQHHHDHCGCGCGEEHHHHHEDGCCCGEEHHHHHHEDDCCCGEEHHHHHEDGCCCGEEHHHHEDNCCDEEQHHRAHGDERDAKDKKVILGGAGLYAVALIVSAFDAPIWVSGLLFVASYLLLGAEVLQTAGRNMTKGHLFDENFLMGVATLGAFLIGEFPEAVGIMLFYRIGEFFEHKAVERSRSQIMETVDLRPESVSLMDNGSVRQIPAEEALVGDVLLVRPGDRIPLDGVVVSGRSRIDTAPITGEPVPIAVDEGDSLISGCINVSSQLTMRVEKPLEQSMVTRILDSVENAATSKPKIDRFITRFARIYTPAVVFAALVIALVPPLVDHNWNYWIYTALSFLVMSCPCALVLSVPLAFFSGIGLGSRYGILFKGGSSIEAMAGVKAVAMDKTGTLTKGDFRVQKSDLSEEALQLCISCEAGSTHPIAQSIAAYGKEQGVVPSAVEHMEEFSGRGLQATVSGKTVLCGNSLLLQEQGIALENLKEDGETRVYVAVDGVYAGCLTIADTMKPETPRAVSQLKKMGCFTAMLTGDQPQGAEAVSKIAGVDKTYARLLPGDKLEVLQQLRREQGGVMFVGDGINDAPVLAGADVGAAMGSGADAAIEAADVVYMTSSMDAVPKSLEIARKTRQIAWQNVIFALVVKFAVMAMGLFGYANMWMAVFADTGVAMLCVLNSIRILYRK